MFWITVAPSRISGMALLINIQLLLNEYISERMNNHWLTTDSPLNFIFLHVLYVLGANSCEWLNFLCCLLTVLAHNIQQLYALLGHILISPVYIGSFSEKIKLFLDIMLWIYDNMGCKSHVVAIYLSVLPMLYIQHQTCFRNSVN